jgi:hypothetical protein
VRIPLIMVSLSGCCSRCTPWVAYGFLLASMVYYARLSLVVAGDHDLALGAACWPGSRAW